MKDDVKVDFEIVTENPLTRRSAEMDADEAPAR